MTTSWHNYPSIFALGHKAVADLLLDPVLVEEKIDGSQFSFGRFNGELRVRSKGVEMSPTKPEKLFAKAVEVAGSLPLQDGWTYRAEYLSKPKHNALAYDRVPTNHIILFDVNSGHEEYLDPEAKKVEAERLGLEVVPTIYSGIITEPKQVFDMIDRVSILGGAKLEGVVIKNYARFGPDKKALMGKYVSEAFKEVHRGEWRKSNPEVGDILTQITLKYRTPARWQKAVQHLLERGELEHSPRDIGKLMQEVQEDILKEEGGEIRDMVFDWAWKKVRTSLAAGLPQWYKDELLKEQFTNGQSGTTGDVTSETADEPVGGPAVALWRWPVSSKPFANTAP